MFIGGLMVAVVVEHSQLHRRISLGILRKVGTNPRFLMLGKLYLLLIIAYMHIILHILLPLCVYI